MKLKVKLRRKPMMNMLQVKAADYLAAGYDREKLATLMDIAPRRAAAYVDEVTRIFDVGDGVVLSLRILELAALTPQFFPECSRILSALSAFQATNRDGPETADLTG